MKRLILILACFAASFSGAQFFMFGPNGQAFQCLPAVSGSSSTLLNGLVAYYKMDENTGTTTADSSGGGNTATSVSTTWTNAAKINSGLIGNGSSSYIYNGLTNVVNVTVAGWFWIDSTGDPFRGLITKYSGGGNRSVLLDSGNGDGTSLEVFVSIGDSLKGGTSTGTIPLNSWVHLCLTYDGANLVFYVNGSVNFTTPVTVSVDTSSQRWNIGGRGDGVNFKGMFDEVGIWNRGLTSAEVTELYNSGAGKQLP